MSNPFEQVHIQAALDTERKRKKARVWELSDVFEIDDLVMNSTRQLKSVARQLFSSLPSDPNTKSSGIQITGVMEGADTPRDAMLRIVRHLLQYHSTDLTKRQKQALEAYDEAVKCGIPPVNYVAKRLGIKQNSASELIKRAKIRYIDENFHSMDEGILITYNPTEQEIKRKMASIPRICAGSFDGCLGETRNGKVALCFPCHVRLKVEYPLIPEWYISEAQRIESEHRKLAINACHKDHYGTVSIEEYESYMDAA